MAGIDENGNGTGNGGRVSVSVDRLRYELAQVTNTILLTKDELKELFRKELADKADKETLDQLAKSVAQVVEWRLRAERGEFTHAQQAEIVSVTNNAIRVKAKEGWSKTNRRLAAFGAITAFIAMLSGAAFTIFTVLTYHPHA